ncbi:hypothetical protein KIPB_010672 [Kipferlia bialata]|uniref:Uncharacterized protein n=1 Tax=Kipferlia bialata TaxID=797122 RepID=A0A9K3GN50_9EUKA|nr:hypothetical protein KIPB_010672 [Kipferlia bialata]|eukprot:g10672.t1
MQLSLSVPGQMWVGGQAIRGHIAVRYTHSSQTQSKSGLSLSLLLSLESEERIVGPDYDFRHPLGTTSRAMPLQVGDRVAGTTHYLPFVFPVPIDTLPTVAVSQAGHSGTVRHVLRLRRVVGRDASVPHPTTHLGDGPALSDTEPSVCIEAEADTDWADHTHSAVEAEVEVPVVAGLDGETQKDSPRVSDRSSLSLACGRGLITCTVRRDSLMADPVEGAAIHLSVGNRSPYSVTRVRWQLLRRWAMSGSGGRGRGGGGGGGGAGGVVGVGRPGTSGSRPTSVNRPTSTRGMRQARRRMEGQETVCEGTVHVGERERGEGAGTHGDRLPIADILIRPPSALCMSPVLSSLPTMTPCLAPSLTLSHPTEYVSVVHSVRLTLHLSGVFSPSPVLEVPVVWGRRVHVHTERGRERGAPAEAKNPPQPQLPNQTPRDDDDDDQSAVSARSSTASTRASVNGVAPLPPLSHRRAAGLRLSASGTKDATPLKAGEALALTPVRGREREGSGWSARGLAHTHSASIPALSDMDGASE